MNKTFLITLLFACSILSMTAGNAPEKKNGATPPPMFLLSNANGLMQMVYWTDTDEPQMNEEYPEFYEEEHQGWELQEQFSRNASQYTKLIVDGGKTRDVKYVDEILLNPDGEKIFPGELHGRPQIPSSGARFALLGQPPLNDEEQPGTVIVTDSYLATHKPMTIRPASEDEILPLPSDVIKKMEAKYGMKVERSVKTYIIGDRYTYGVLQFQGEYKNPDKNRTKTKKTPWRWRSSWMATRSLPIPWWAGMIQP